MSDFFVVFKTTTRVVDSREITCPICGSKMSVDVITPLDYRYIPIIVGRNGVSKITMPKFRIKMRCEACSVTLEIDNVIRFIKSKYKFKHGAKP